MNPRRAALWCGALTLSVAVALFGAGALGYRWNVTASVPRGLYRVVPLHVARGELVTVCPDPRLPVVRMAQERHYLPTGPCPGGFAPLLKPIAGLPGDQVETTDAGLTVNGRLIPGTRPWPRDAYGNPLPLQPARYTVPPGHVVLLTSSPVGFDSRYMGPISEASITAAATPIMVF